MKTNKKKLQFYLIPIALVFWVAVWYFVAKKVGLSFILPTPLEVGKRFWELVTTLSFYKVLLTSFLRILLGYLSGVILGTVLGFFAYKSFVVNTLLSPIMSIIRATPVASFIVVVLLWMNTDLVPSFIALLMVLPIVWQNTILGWESRDAQLGEMAKVFRLGWKKTFLFVDLPQVLPSVATACKTALGLAWKAGIAAEVLALPELAVGSEIYDAKLYFATPDLYAWTAAVILFSLCLEKILSLIFSCAKKGEEV